jgi:predicted ArsR family transcriptional regulator
VVSVDAPGIAKPQRAAIEDRIIRALTERSYNSRSELAKALDLPPTNGTYRRAMTGLEDAGIVVVEAGRIALMDDCHVAQPLGDGSVAISVGGNA